MPKHIILASGSPRRKELMAGLGFEFTIDTGNTFEESIPEGAQAHEVPVLMAQGKSDGFHRPLEEGEVLVTADTVVIIDGRVLGKPHSRPEAIEMLRTLQSRTHEVLTAVVIRDSTRSESFTDSTLVTFGPLSDDEIAYYIDTYRPYDKAGAYGVQEWIGYVAIERLEGSFYNVMGFPVHKVFRALIDDFGATMTAE